MSDTNQTYQWTGINKQGVRTKGIISAPDLKSAEIILQTTGVSVISLTLKKASSLAFSFPQKRIKSKEIVLFTRFLSAMLAAGMPILKALDIIARDQTNDALKTVVNSLRNSISSGTTFAQALGEHPKYFNELYRSLVSAGEKSATLDKVLSRLEKHLEKVQALKNKIRNALVYPIAIVVVATAVSLILLVFVIPQFQTMFKNANVPLPTFTRLVIHLSDFVRSYWWLIIGFIAGSIFVIKYLKRKNEAVSDWFDKITLKMFFVGSILKKAIIARFTRTLSITLEAGLPIVESMKSMINVMGNRIYSKGVKQICESIISGNELSKSMEATKLFPNMVIQMISVGEVSGKLEEMLSNVANYYEEDVDSIAANISTLLEPIIIVVLGIIIGCFVVAMYLPIFKLGSTI